MNNPERIETACGGHFCDEHAAFVRRALAYEAFAHAQLTCMSVRCVVGVSGEKHHFGRFVCLHLVDHALLRVDERRKLGQKHTADGREIALTLEHPCEAREIGFEPVLLLVPVGGEPQIVNHRVDVVFELGDFAAGLDLNRAGEVAFRNCGRYFRDSTDLVGEVVREQVYVASEIFPGACSAGNVGLSTEAALHTYFTRNCRHLISKRGQRIGHVVDGFRQCRDFALGVHGELLRVSSPFATAVTTLTIPLTCSVRLAAMTLTLSVKSFHVPATPETWA